MKKGREKKKKEMSDKTHIKIYILICGGGDFFWLARIYTCKTLK